MAEKLNLKSAASTRRVVWRTPLWAEYLNQALEDDYAVNKIAFRPKFTPSTRALSSDIWTFGNISDRYTKWKRLMHGMPQKVQYCTKYFPHCKTRSQAVARIADRTASQQTSNNNNI